MITYFGGPEGAGKTALMTYFLRKHHLMGGEIWAFPGYELKNNRNKVISKLINPTEIMGLINEMQYIVLAIDEIQNFMNHHAWQNPIIDVLTYGALAQRRKREFGVMVTGPFFNTLPPDLKAMFHIIFQCADKHWKNHKIPRGEQIKFSEIDLRGVLSGRPYTTNKPKIFRPAKYFKYYDTFSLIDPKYQNLRIMIKKDVIEVDSDGNVIKKADPKEISSIIGEFLKAQGDNDTITKYELNNYVATRLGKDYLEHDEITTLGRLMGGRGFRNNMRKALWQIPEGVMV